MSALATDRPGLQYLVPRRIGGVPTSAFLQLSDSCNHSCVHCYQVHGQRGELGTDEVKRVLDDFVNAGILFVSFTGGEVTLRSDFLEIVAYARSLRFAVRVYTNAYLVDEALAERLAALAVLEVHVSVYSANPADHDAVTLVPGSFERTLAGVRAMRRHEVPVVLKMPFLRTNSDSYRDVIALANELGCGWMINPTIDVREDGHCAPVAMRASREALERLVADPAIGMWPAGLKPQPKAPTDLPCGACAVAYVSPDGTLRPCTGLPFAIGNLRDQTVGEAYEASAAVRFAQTLRWQDLPACRSCDLKDYCSRCHANALLEDGDIFGPSRAACEWARVRFHRGTETSAQAGEPDVGPFEAHGDGRLTQRAWQRGTRQIPVEMPSALVVGREVPRGSGKPRIRLRVVPQGA